MFHFVPCNYDKKRERKVLKIKIQEFKVQYSALKFREDQTEEEGGSGQVRLNAGAGLDSSDDVQMCQPAAGYSFTKKRKKKKSFIHL